MVYAKTPLGGPAQVLEYLSRYTHRTAISNERIRTITDTEVVFSVRANEHGAKRLERQAGAEFVRRFMLHILPTGIKRIRHYGLCWHQAAKQSSSTQRERHYKCRCPMRRPWSLPKALSRGWPTWMWACVRVAGSRACTSALCLPGRPVCPNRLVS